MTRTPRTIGAATRSSRLACARPTLRGLEPTSTNETPVMMSAARSSTRHQMLSNSSAKRER